MRAVGAVSIVGLALGVVVILTGVFQPTPLCVEQVGQPSPAIFCARSLEWPLVTIGSAIVLPSALGLAWSMRRKSNLTNQSSHMNLLDSRLFIGGIIILTLSIFLFAGLAVETSYCNPNADVTSGLCTNKSLPWLPLLGLPFGLVMVGYPLVRSRRTLPKSGRPLPARLV
jgi:hypothetical protein